MTDPEDAAGAFEALLPQLSAEASRIGLHLQASLAAASPAPGEPMVLVARFLAADLAWSDQVQKTGDELDDYVDELADIELDVAIQTAEEANERRRSKSGEPFLDLPGPDLE